ncbi:class I SAM-dependent methyltransferase [Pseudoalteromonas fenneropenaei]|uniref:Class I SAM-dependent methyltransferase n=1 Tax=Pseudoalteromonas fenneropenaei TaxID=1737459 RepID=A0ABV7CME4_9GAMM
MEKVTQSSQSVSHSFGLTALYRKLVHGAFANLKQGAITLVEGNNVVVLGERGAFDVTLTVNDMAMYRDFALGGSVGAGESYIAGRWQVDDLTRLIELFVVNQAVLDAVERKYAWFSGIAHSFKHWQRRNGKTRAKQNILAHYDLGNALYEKFLSEEMLYSSAVFESNETSLEQAQQHKMKLICERLDLQPGQTLVEIGTGWGALAIYAAQHYGVHVTTTTISEQQHAYVSAKIADLGLNDKITLLKQDYRDLTGTYDKLVSIEMIEAVGHAYLPTFFAKCNALLKANGAMLLQAITIADQRYQHYLRKSDFIQQYIFPGGCLPSINEITTQLATMTDCVMHELHDIGLHYAQTLAHWRQRFYAAWPEISQMQFDQQFFRLWEFYLCYCEGAFRQRATSTVHLVARKPAYFAKSCEVVRNYTIG